MLETLRAYGLERLAEAGERPGAAAALARYALQVAEQAAAGLQTSAGELAAARGWTPKTPPSSRPWPGRWSTTRRTALRLAMALAPWWRLRGRAVAGYALLRAAAGHAAPGERRVVCRAVLAGPRQTCYTAISPRRSAISPRSVTPGAPGAVAGAG